MFSIVKDFGESDLEFHEKASLAGISPKVVNFDKESKTMVLEKLEELTAQEFNERKFEIFELLLLAVRILSLNHLDPGTQGRFNVMKNDERLYLIDWTDSERVTYKDEKHSLQICVNNFIDNWSRAFIANSPSKLREYVYEKYHITVDELNVERRMRIKEEQRKLIKKRAEDIINKKGNKKK
jgi:RIO-like serine/threonine protein kinase